MAVIFTAIIIFDDKSLLYVLIFPLCDYDF